MPNPSDFRAEQIQSNKLIVSGSTETNAKFLVYPIEAQLAGSPNVGAIDPNVFGTGSIGTDVFMFVSGGINTRTSASNATSVFGGDLVVSGALDAKEGVYVNGVPCDERWLIYGVVDGGDSPYAASISELVIVDCAPSGSVSIEFPAISSTNRGQKIGVKVRNSDEEDYTVTLKPDGSDTMDDETDQYMYLNTQWTIWVSDGIDNWMQMG